ncbi:hypothetical protein [Sphingopyxis sp. PET50]|uniref:hypothetical protein n=1 Tax=Sphingopyxis sp. PET50 TaxID=2976533 RepID=UPI0021AFF371|nr:hypothetical protein [Sphingopyxis sp. PET50]
MLRSWTKRLLVAAAVALTPAAPAAAQRDLTIAPGTAWTHAHSGITVPPTLGGNALVRAKAYAEDELDVGLSFEPEGAEDFISFYIFRNTNGAAPVWFAQAQWAIENRDIYGAAKLAAAPRAFAAPGQTTQSGLRAVYEPQTESHYRSTGLALVPVGGWYVKLRISSLRRTPAELDALMDSVIGEIRWPQHAAPAGAARPVIPCTAPLTFDKKSRDVTSGGMEEILAAAMVSAAAGDDSVKKDPVSTTPVQWCRDRQMNNNIATYRADEAADAYLLTFGDNGNGVTVGLSSVNTIMAELEGKKGKPRYSVTLHTAAEDANFVSQDRLPSPERAAEIVNANRRTSTVATWGKERAVQINSNAIK